MRLHHVQVACPPGGEDAARAFYVDGLGLTEVEKPAPLRGRGGLWLRSYEDDDPGGAVTAELHVGVEDPFVPARKAHPALVVTSIAGLDRLATDLEAAGWPVDRSERTSFPGYLRFHVHDPHGNRVEVLSPRA